MLLVRGTLVLCALAPLALFGWRGWLFALPLGLLACAVSDPRRRGEYR